MSKAVALPNTERLDNYLRQMFSRPLSSRQERRLRKHENRAKGSPQGAPMEEFVEVGPPASRPCGGTDHCITASGAKAKKTHVKCENL